MEELLELAKVLLPAALVAYAIYLTVNSFLKKDFERRLVDIKLKNIDTVLPLRLQAYERMCLFLERITPNNLILRTNNGDYSAAELHGLLLSEIREEFGHNLSQQVYMSDEAWYQVKGAMEEVVVLINNAAAQVGPDARGMDLARRVFETIIAEEIDPTGRALKFIKNEVRQETF
jgi:hypothetical protein